MSDTELLIKEVENLPSGCMDHTPNAETIAAFEEGDAMLRGEIPSAVSFDPAKYTTKEELKAALMEALIG
jgi:hypothetical protein